MTTGRLSEQDRARGVPAALGGHDGEACQGARRRPRRTPGDGGEGVERPAGDHPQAAQAVRGVDPAAQASTEPRRAQGDARGEGWRLVRRTKNVGGQIERMISLERDELIFRFPEVHDAATCRMEFQRTLRIPDNGKDHPLPPGLGSFPLRHFDDYARQLPRDWLQRGGVMMPMHHTEAMMTSDCVPVRS